MGRVLVVSHDVLGERMAGPAIRAVELSRVLAEEHDVTLAAPNDCAVNLGLRTVRFTHPGLPALAAVADVVIVGGLTLALCPALAQVGVPLVVDIYDPFTLENLQLFSSREMPVRIDDSEGLLRALLLQLRLGDYYVCASEKQRDFWMGVLHAAGRLNPHTYDADRSLRALVDIVPFGVPESPPIAQKKALKGSHPGIGTDDFVAVWGGGVYDWFDPLTAIRATGLAASRNPAVKLFFMGVRNPNPAIHRMKVVDECRALADSLGLTDRAVFFNDWVPYTRRADYLLDSDVGISLHHEQVETAYSFRTRILDYLWAGLPIVATAGDSFAEAIARRGIGRVLPAGDADAVAETLLELAAGRDREGMGEQARAMAAELTWPRCAAPLVEFCRHPGLAADRAAGYRFAESAPAGNAVAGIDLARKGLDSLRRGGLTQLADDVRSYLAWRRGS